MSQTIPPEICILSDDGSTDKTPIIVAELGAEVLINKIQRFKVRGINQVLALNAGISMATDKVPDWKYLLKFDGDTVIPENYVEHLLIYMEKYARLGICAGKPDNDTIRLSRASDAAKFYRRECWDEIQGLDIWTAFDSHAILKAAQAGWYIRTIPTISFKELRPSRKFGLTRWVLTGFERASFGFPLYHTVLASIKNVKWGSPPILNVIATTISHIINPWSQAPNLDQEFIKQYAINEIRHYLAGLLQRYPH